MLKTNSKKALLNIQNYIIEGIDYDRKEYDNNDNIIKIFNQSDNFDTLRTKLLKIVISEQLGVEPTKTFKNYYKYSFYEVFKDWAQGLPSALDIGYYYNINAINLLGNILEETEQEKARFTESQAEEKLTQLIYKVLTKDINIWELIK